MSKMTNINIKQLEKQLSNKRVLKTNIDGRKKKLTEQVSDITGVVIPSIWEYNKTGKMKIYDYICKNINEMSGDLIKIYKSISAISLIFFFHLLTKLFYGKQLMN